MLSTSATKVHKFRIIWIANIDPFCILDFHEGWILVNISVFYLIISCEKGLYENESFRDGISTKV